MSFSELLINFSLLSLRETHRYTALGLQASECLASSFCTSSRFQQHTSRDFWQVKCPGPGCTLIMGFPLVLGKVALYPSIMVCTNLLFLKTLIVKCNSAEWIANKDLVYIAQGTLLNVIWQFGWEGSLEGNGYMYMFSRVSLLFMWNYHNIVDQL